MKVVKWAFGAIALLIVAVVATGMLLPRQISVERSVEISASPGVVFPHINSLKAMSSWSPWMDRDPDMVVTYSGADSGKGAMMEWTSDQPDVGNGRQKIKASDLNKSVLTALDFGDMGTAEAKLILDPIDDITKVIWTLDADMGLGPVGRWMGLMMDDWVGADYEKGLGNLKELVER